ncbi:glycoside hydrolase family 3 protein [Hyphobacterium sp. CCMP332]|nr:glycoside hydrolase family 3 protein [Hyphobacterium sp. CCMP332]
MKKLLNNTIPLIIFLLISYSTACQSREQSSFSLKDYYIESSALDKKVNKLFNEMSNKEKASQMIITAAGKYGKPHEEVIGLVREKTVGGVLLLNGTKEGFSDLVRQINEISKKENLTPQIFSADAEPSLLNYKIKGTEEVPKTSSISNVETSRKVAAKISNELLNIGINHNYAPVIDISQDNEAIGNRSYGSDPLQVVNLAMAFMEMSQDMEIVSTIKHFPGHGNVKGDTHEKLVFIDGEMTEVQNYQPFIDAGALSIMVAHLAVKNNQKYDTRGLPASCSRNIVSDLLRSEMKFEGIIITDAMNMGALKEFGNAPLLAAQAGCDLILMPMDERKLNKDLQLALTEKSAFKNQLEESIKRVLRLKVCLGLL